MKKDYPNKITIEAMQETERLLADPNTKYYDVEEALVKLKGMTVKKAVDKIRKIAYNINVKSSSC